MPRTRDPGTPSRARAGSTYLLAIGSAVLAWLGFVGVGIWPLAFVAYVPLFLALDRARARGLGSVIGHALAFGVVAWTGGYYWMLPTLERFSGLGPLASVGLATLFWILQAGHAVFFGVLWSALRKRAWGPTSAAVAAFGTAEFVYPQMFPSYYGAALHTVTPLMQLAEWGGPLLLSVLCMGVNGAVYEFASMRRARVGRRRAAPLVVAGALALSLVLGAVRLAQVDERVREATTLRVGLVQANLPAASSSEGAPSRVEQHVARSADLLRHGVVDLLIWPESACEGPFEAPVETVRPKVPWGLQAPLLFGTIVSDRGSGSLRRFNSALLAGVNGRVLGRYDKNHLVAFSEHAPHDIPLPRAARGADFSAGTSTAPLELRDARIAVLLCFEDILPDYVRRVAAEATPNLLVNLTNDAWFGRTSEPRIHAALARFRAIEHRTSLVRATNTGMTAVYGPGGRVLAEAPPFEPAILTADVPLLPTQRTLYARFGDWVGWLCLLAAAGMLSRRRPRRGT